MCTISAMAFLFRRASKADEDASLPKGSSSASSTPMPEILGGRRHSSIHSKATDRKLSVTSIPDINADIVDPFVRSGILAKKGVINQSYQKRWFFLTKKSLAYFDATSSDETVLNKLALTFPKGEIELKYVTSVSMKEPRSAETPRDRFDVVTPTRVYKLRAPTHQEAEAWIAAISGAVEATKRAKPEGRGRRSSTNHIIESLKLDESFAGADIQIYTPAALNSWSTWSAFDVAAWIGTFNFHTAGRHLFVAGVRGDRLPTLSSSDLETIGIKSKDDQLALLKRINNLVKSS